MKNSKNKHFPNIHKNEMLTKETKQHTLNLDKQFNKNKQKKGSKQNT